MDRAEWFGQKGVRGCKEGALLGSLSWRGTCRSWGAGTPLQGCCWTQSPKKSCSMWGGRLRGLNTSGTRLVAVMDIGLVGAAQAAGSTSGGWMEGRGCKQGAGLLPRSRLLS